MAARDETNFQIEISNRQSPRQLAGKNAQRTPLVLVVDASISMEFDPHTGSDPIGEVNRGLKLFERELKDDLIAKDRARILVIRAGGDVTNATEWNDGSDFAAPSLVAGGHTPLGEAMDLALRQCRDQKSRIEASGVASTLPYIMLLSDGEPNDDGWEDIARACRRAEAAGEVFVLPFGTKEANLEKLRQFTNASAFRLEDNSFQEFFRFIARTMKSVTRSKPGDKLRLELPPSITIPT